MSRDGLRLPDGSTNSTFQDVTRTDVATGAAPLKRALDVAISGVGSSPAVATSAPTTQVARSATVQTALAANTSRKSFILWNDTTALCYVRFSAGATTAIFTLRIPSNDGYEPPDGVIYTGLITAIWATGGSGNLNVTELT